MEKTLKYQLNESYAEGYNDARKMVSLTVGEAAEICEQFRTERDTVLCICDYIERTYHKIESNLYK